MHDPHLHGPTPYHDGIRDPFRWARFGQGPFLVMGLLVVLVLVVASTRGRGFDAKRDGFQTAMHVIEQTWRTKRSLTWD
jgi:hypothetical protein